MTRMAHVRRGGGLMGGTIGSPTGKNVVPDSAFPVEGIRHFNFSGPDVYSLTRPGTKWDESPQKATCEVDAITLFPMLSHLFKGSPIDKCTCGLYSYFKDPTQPLHKTSTPTVLYPTSTSVVGEVEGWGRVIIHDNGFRAQYMKITKMYVSSDWIRHMMRYKFQTIPIEVVD